MLLVGSRPPCYLEKSVSVWIAYFCRTAYEEAAEEEAGGRG